MSHMMRYRLHLFVSLLALLLSLTGQAHAQSVEAQGQAARSITTARVDHAPALDGTLKDPLWQQAAIVADFHQREPFEKEPATEKTVVRVLYDRRFLYFGIHCS